MDWKKYEIVYICIAIGFIVIILPFIIGDCDVADLCDGAHSTCPSDICKPAGYVCRPSAGICDVAEVCDGQQPLCPVDSVQRPTLVCRNSTGQCDPAEYCDGNRVTCPANVFLPDNTTCDSHQALVESSCRNGLCVVIGM